MVQFETYQEQKGNCLLYFKMLRADIEAVNKFAKNEAGSLHDNQK
jgi:hypothetical protein